MGIADVLKHIKATVAFIDRQIVRECALVTSDRQFREHNEFRSVLNSQVNQLGVTVNISLDVSRDGPCLSDGNSHFSALRHTARHSSG